jgi:hypothetical protein
MAIPRETGAQGDLIASLRDSDGSAVALKLGQSACYAHRLIGAMSFFQLARNTVAARVLRLHVHNRDRIGRRGLRPNCSTSPNLRPIPSKSR